MAKKNSSKRSAMTLDNSDGEPVDNIKSEKSNDNPIEEVKASTKKDVYAMSLKDFANEQATTKTIELMAGFVHEQRQKGNLKDSREDFLKLFGEFCNRPVV